jgi:hypothetical protein
MTIAAMLDAARAALRGEPGPQVLRRRDRAPAVAFLVTLSRAEGDLVVPLRSGPNLVGRGFEGNRPNGDWPSPPAVEQVQWFIECGPDGAEVRDAASTNLSVLLPSTRVGGVDLGLATDRFLPLFELLGAVPLPHPNVPSKRYRYPLTEGDVLRGCYAAFAFGWFDR